MLVEIMREKQIRERDETNRTKLTFYFVNFITLIKKFFSCVGFFVNLKSSLLKRSCFFFVGYHFCFCV